MYPLQHALLAVCPVVAYVLVRYRRLPRGRTLLVVLFGSQLPDLVDKPLAYTVGILPSGRVFMHSLVFAVLLFVLVLVLAARLDRAPLGRAYVIGHLLHLPGDFYTEAFRSPLRVLQTPAVFERVVLEVPTGLFWPLLHVPRSTPPAGYERPLLLVEFSGPRLVAVALVTVAVLYATVDMYVRWLENQPLKPQ